MIDKEDDASEKATLLSKQAVDACVTDENPPPTPMQELPIVSVDKGGVLSELKTFKLDLEALGELGLLADEIGDDRIFLNS